MTLCSFNFLQYHRKLVDCEIPKLFMLIKNFESFQDKMCLNPDKYLFFDAQKDCVYEYQNFLLSLADSKFFGALSEYEKQVLFDYYKAQVYADYEQQIQVINTFFKVETGLTSGSFSDDLTRKAMRIVKRLRQVAASPSFIGFPLEELIDRNWQSGTGKDTIGQLFIDRSNEIFSEQPFAPSKSELENSYFLLEQAQQLPGCGASKYARYDVFKHPIYCAYLENIVSGLLGMDYRAIFNSNNQFVTLATSGAATIQRVISAVSYCRLFERENSCSDFHLYLGNMQSYFETNKVFKHTSFNLTGNYTGETVHLNHLANQASDMQETLQLAKQKPGIHLFWFENIGNNPNMDIPDLEKIFTYMDQCHRDAPREKSKFIFCFDISILAGHSEYFMDRIKKLNKSVNIILTSSLTKFATLGTNRANLGLIYGQGEDIHEIFRHIFSFQSTEGYPSLHTIATMPLVTKEVLLERKRRISDNVQFLSSKLNASFEELFEITSPSLQDHPDHTKVLRYYEGYVGPFFYLKFGDLEQVNRIMEDLKRNPLIDFGTSYGFNRTRVEIVRDIDTGDEIPIIRVSPGTENIRKLLLLLESLEQAINQLYI